MSQESGTGVLTVLGGAGKLDGECHTRKPKKVCRPSAPCQKCRHSSRSPEMLLLEHCTQNPYLSRSQRCSLPLAALPSVLDPYCPQHGFRKCKLPLATCFRSTWSQLQALRIVSMYTKPDQWRLRTSDPVRSGPALSSLCQQLPVTERGDIPQPKASRSRPTGKAPCAKDGMPSSSCGI